MRARVGCKKSIYSWQQLIYNMLYYCYASNSCCTCICKRHADIMKNHVGSDRCPGCCSFLNNDASECQVYIILAHVLGIVQAKTSVTMPRCVYNHAWRCSRNDRNFPKHKYKIYFFIFQHTVAKQSLHCWIGDYSMMLYHLLSSLYTGIINDQGWVWVGVWGVGWGVEGVGVEGFGWGMGLGDGWGVGVGFGGWVGVEGWGWGVGGWEGWGRVWVWVGVVGGRGRGLGEGGVGVRGGLGGGVG